MPGRRTAVQAALLAVVLLTACAAPVPVGEPGEAPRSAGMSEAFARARAFHLAGVDGDARGAAEARRAFAALVEASPGRADLRAYLGSAMMLVARDLPLTRRFGAVREALATLDAAVAAAPEDAVVRALRGLSCAPLPSFFGRRAQARGDLAAVAARVSEPDSGLAPGLAAQVLTAHAAARFEAGDRDAARSAWRRAVAIAPGSRGGREAAARLEAR